MKPILVVPLSSVLLLAAGCGYRSYEMRLEATESRIRDEMTLDQVLSAPVGGDFQKLNIYFRPPKNWAGSADFAPELRRDGFNSFDDELALAFDLKASYSAPSPAGSNTQAKDAPPPPPGPILRFLARRTQEQSDTEKGEAPPPIERGEFQSDLRQRLATYYGVDLSSITPEPAPKTVWPRTTQGRAVNYERWKFNGINNQLIQVYVFKEKSGSSEYDAALIFEFPDGQVPTASSNPVDLTLGTFAVGTRAANRFRGASDDDEGAIEGTGGAAVAF